MIVVVVVACSKEKKEEAPAAAAGPGGASPTAEPTTTTTPTTPSPTTPPASASALATPAAADPCRVACDHRASCGLGDAAACATDCGAMLALGTLEEPGLRDYAAAACDRVKEIESQFQIGAACHKACTHRSDCIPGASAKDCIPDCAALVVVSKQEPTAAVAGYLAKDCDGVKADEPVLACLRSCRHVLGCGVSGDLESCLGYCGQQLSSGVTVEQVAQLQQLDCAEATRTIQIPSNDAPTGGASHLCVAEGSYTSCTNGCRDLKGSATGLAANLADARMLATAKCNSSMQNGVLLSPAGSRARIKSSCAIKSCN